MVSSLEYFPTCNSFLTPWRNFSSFYYIRENLMRKLFENFKVLQFQNRIFAVAAIWGNLVYESNKFLVLATSLKFFCTGRFVESFSNFCFCFGDNIKLAWNHAQSALLLAYHAQFSGELHYFKKWNLGLGLVVLS